MDILTQKEYRREYLRRWEAVRYAKTKGFNATLAARVAIGLMGRGLRPDEIREALYLAARDGVFGIMETKKQRGE
jgi:hypothetical protein